MRNQIPLKYLS